jgi:tetratricopeptide (TPR) repeat protein
MKKTISLLLSVVGITTSLLTVVVCQPKADGLSAEEYFMKGENAKENKWHNLAIEYYQKAIEVNPNHVKAYISIGDTYYFRLNNYPEAIRYYQKAIAVDPDHDAWIYYDMGRVYIHMENYSEAIRCFQKAAALGHTTAQRWLKNNGYN